MTTESNYQLARAAIGNVRAGITKREIMVAGEDLGDRFGGRRDYALSSADAVVWDERNRDLAAVSDAISAAGQRKLFVFGERTELGRGSDGVSFLGFVGDINVMVAAAAICKTHAAGPVWLPCSKHLVELISRVESPAEARFAVAWENACKDEWELCAQTPIGQFRADFTVTNGAIGKPCMIAVEIDGHEWHERTKEQASRDKARDRAIQIAGWKVLHFTGQEVWRSPEQCARQVYGILMDNWNEAFIGEAAE